MLIHKY